MRWSALLAAGVVLDVVVVGVLVAGDVWHEGPFADADGQLALYFADETERLEREGGLSVLIEGWSDDTWTQVQSQWRGELLEMLGLDPLPEKTPLDPRLTGAVDRDGVRVEKLHFQSLPGLYVTANLYLPIELSGPLPAVLYLCGHGAVREGEISFGNKVHYQHHGAWFARHGYACLVIDSLQLGEIEGMHHGTYRYDQWWWLCRGYTPAGVEAWNALRALDYLASREEVDPQRLGVTGRSGGGAYSWWIAAIDDRVRAAVPVAGITDLRNHVVDGCVDGHCDCMFFVNNHRWDYPRLTALVAPRPLLISNTDRDAIFPLDGVYRTYRQLRPLYERLGAGERLGLHVTSGPHEDTQELRIHAFRWLNRHLRGDDELIEQAARPLFQPRELKVFEQLPGNEINTRIAETFVPPARPLEEQLAAGSTWAALRDEALGRLERLAFAGWPGSETSGRLDCRSVWSGTADGIRGELFALESQPHVTVPLWVFRRQDAAGAGPEYVELRVADEPLAEQFASLFARHWPESFDSGTPAKAGDADSRLGETERTWKESVAALESGGVQVVIFPRGVGPVAWSGGQVRQVRIRRRFYLLGQTVDGMRVWDVRRAIQATRRMWGDEVPVRGHGGEGADAGLLLYASLFEPPLREMTLRGLPVSHRAGPYLLSVQRVLDLPWAASIAAERQPVRLLAGGDAEVWAGVLERFKQAKVPHLPELVR